MIDEKEPSQNVKMVAKKIDEIARRHVYAITDSNPLAMLYDAKLDDVIKEISDAKERFNLPGDYNFFDALKECKIQFDLSESIDRVSEQIAIDMLKDLEKRGNNINSPGHYGQ